MNGRTFCLLPALALTLAGCGRPDASGTYLSTADRQVALVQLTQTRDGTVSGRLEAVALGQGGALNDQSVALAGSASKHALAFKSAAGFPGATGSFTRDRLALSGPGFALNARRSKLADYQAALGQLQTRADSERRRLAETQAKQAAASARASPLKDAGDKAARLDAAAAQLSADSARLDAGVKAAPEFGEQAAANTSDISVLAQQAVSGRDRGPLIAQANQLIVDTSRIDVARTQYAVGLDQIIQRASPLAAEVEQYCESQEAAAYGPSCAKAKAAATGFESALVHAATVFKTFKRAVYEQRAQQNALLRRMGG